MRGIKFRNDSGGVLGVLRKNAEGKLKGVALGIGDEVWLDRDEQIATAQAPKRPADNPFNNGGLTRLTEEGDQPLDRPIGDSLDVSTAPAPEPPAPPDEDEPPAQPPASQPEAPAAPAPDSEEEAVRKAAVARASSPPIPPDQTPPKAPAAKAVAKPVAPAQGQRSASEQVGTPSAQE